MQATLPGIDRALALVADRSVPQLPLSHREFARRFVRMPPDGPRAGQMYRDEWQPVIGVLWDELDKGCWSEVVVTGPVQASKSFGALVVPTLRDVHQLRVSPIVAVPEADTFADKWDRDFLPVLDASRELSALIPLGGSGARGGRVKDRLTLGTGIDIKVMSRGGKATNKASYTTQRLRITEAAGFSDASSAESDQEADAYRQLVARLGAFDYNDPRRLVLIEGTGTVAEALPWRLRGEDDEEVLISSRSRLVSPCPHCEAWISPEREHLVGWKGAQSIVQVLEQARFVCPECGGQIDDEQRRKSLQDVRIVHHWQEITPDGTITGPAAPVLRLWFRWSAWHNCLIGAGTTAVYEWEASQIEDGTIDRENAERDLCQKRWAIPYKPSEGDNPRLDAKVLTRRVGAWQRGVLPEDTDILTIGIDPGKWTGWWLALATQSDGSEYVPAYGAFDVMREASDSVSERIYAALVEFNQERILEGFPQAGADGFMLPDAVGIDIADWPDDIAAALREFGQGWNERWFATRGAGISVKKNNFHYKQPTKIGGEVKRIGRQWYAKWNYDRKIPEITVNADFWLRDTQDRLRSKPDLQCGVHVYKPGSITFYKVDHPKEHNRLTNHLAAEQLEDVFDRTTGLPTKKMVRHGDNHLSDCLKIARVMADYVRRRRARQVPTKSLAEMASAARN